MAKNSVLDLPAPLRHLVTEKFQIANRSSSLTFSDTQLSTIHTRSGRPFQLRYCPALAKKPQPKNDSTPSNPTEKPDPFENPSSDLLVLSIPRDLTSHILVLNKYPVIPNHFILATKTNKPQTSLLEPSDLATSYACLHSWSTSTSESNPGPHLFAFFNSGPHSGASQAHRHLQFLPLEDMLFDAPRNTAWKLLIDGMNSPIAPGLDTAQDFLHDPGLPFAHFACRLPEEPSEDELHHRYSALYRKALEAVDAFSPPDGDSEGLNRKDPNAAAISYNLAMTLEKMAICPRRSESAHLPSSQGDGEVALNGTLLAGTLMVKDEGEYKNLQKDKGLLDSVLKTIGIPVENDRETDSKERL